MFHSIIIVDPRGEIRAKQDISTFVVRPTVKNKAEAVRIEDIREAIAWSSKSSFDGKQRRLIIESFQKSSSDAPHTLLKLLEEPPEDLQIIILISQLERLLPTIISRCVAYTATKLTSDQLASWGLVRQTMVEKGNEASWADFSSKSAIEQHRVIANLLKSKKSLVDIFTQWRQEATEMLAAMEPHMALSRTTQVHHLEVAITALEANVLPRLVAHNLVIQLNKS